MAILASFLQQASSTVCRQMVKKGTGEEVRHQRKSNEEEGMGGN